VVVWQARRLSGGAPSPGEFEVVQASADLRPRLITEARNGARFADDQIGELVAIKIALPGREADLERSLTALRRLGTRALRLYYPGPSLADDLWAPGFPCTVVEWADGTKLSESPLFTEVTGLEVCFQIADIVAGAREAAPDIVLTESLKPDNVIVAYDEQNRLRVRIIDWNAYATDQAEIRESTLLRFGEIMTRVFAPDMPFAVNWTTNTAPMRLLGAGQPGEPGATEWDGLTYGTQALIRRTLKGDFDGDADGVVRALRQNLKDQRARWAEDDALWQARLESGPARLNWLDIASARQGRLSAEARERLNEDRLRELREIVVEHTNGGRHLEAVVDLRTALRRHPHDSYFRWAMLAHSVALAGPEMAFRRLHLDEGLSHLQGGRYAQAETAFERGVALFDDLDFEAPGREEARRHLEALLLAAESLALTDSAMNSLAEDWRVEDAESRMTLAEELAGRSEGLSRPLLTGRDVVCQQKLVELRGAVAAFHERHRGYDPGARKREAVEQARLLNFNRLADRARTLATRDQPDSWAAAQQLFDRAADEYPDLWREEHDQERASVAEKTGRRRLQDAREALAAGHWATAATALAHAALNSTTRDDAIRLQAAMSAYQRGDLELVRGDAAAAYASFAYAAVSSEELRARAEGRAAEARASVAAQAPEPGTAAGASAQPAGAALGEELQRQLSESSAAMTTLLQQALAQLQAHAAEQTESVKKTQEEHASRLQAALRQLQEEQASRLQPLLSQMPAEQMRQQQAMQRKLFEEQSTMLKTTLIELYDEQAGWQQAIMKQLQDQQRDQPAQQQAAFKKIQDDLAARLKEAVQKLQDEIISRQQSSLTHMQEELTQRLLAREKAESNGSATAPTVILGPTSTAEAPVPDLKWELEKQAAAQQALASRTSRILFLNVVTVLALLAVGVIVVLSLIVPFVGRGQSTQAGPSVGAPAATAPAPALTTSEPQIETSAPTIPAPTSVPAASPTVPPVTEAAGLECDSQATSAGSYNCAVTNPGNSADNLSLFIQAEGGQMNGFSPSVSVANQGSLLPDSVTNLVALGTFGPDETKSVTVILSCLAASGCDSATFVVALWSGEDSQIVPGSQVLLPAEYPASGQ
jgi:hypothetical protein